MFCRGQEQGKRAGSTWRKKASKRQLWQRSVGQTDEAAENVF